ncbi:outer membrane protein assembly factor BamD [bacterium]|nr:outer membrane protein assembly factor BamD [bacterium]
MGLGSLKARWALWLLLPLFSCSEYQKVLKSPDMEYKLNKAIEYYNKQNYNKCYPLFEVLLTTTRGSKRAEEVYYYYAQTQHKLRDNILAAYHFKNLYKTFPNSVYADEAAFMAAYCTYLESPVYSLDQSYTYKAINEFQLYVNTHPGSPRIEEANRLMDELRSKLERKSYEIARQFYHREMYQSATVAFTNTLSDFPDTEYRESILFYKVISAHELAKNSIDAKKKQRYRETVTACNEFRQAFPNSDYLKRTEAIKAEALEKMQRL